MAFAPPTAFDWSTADYTAWNRRLVDHLLLGHRGQTIVRLPASPEELRAIAGDKGADPEEVATSFVSAMRGIMPRGTSFCGFCCRERGWTPDSLEPPHFFGALWFTCLVASGYPDDRGSFYDRFAELMGKRDNLISKHARGCLVPLWEKVADWTSRHPKYSTLRLPRGDSWRKIIGTSYYLAFPNGRDRRVLTDLLAENELLGFEPPIVPVVDAVIRGTRKFGRDFRQALEHFQHHYLAGGVDPVDSPFWRAIRSVALDEREGEERTHGTPGGAVSLIASWDDDDMLALTVVAKETECSAGTTAHPMPNHVGGYRYTLADRSGDEEALVRSALSDPSVLPAGLASLLRQGVLVFQEGALGDYRLAWGEDINGASVALVHHSVEKAFRSVFGGSAQSSHFAGWSEIEQSDVRQLTKLPLGLERVRSLLHTTSAPRPRLVGKIDVGDGYLWLPGVEPRIRAPDAVSVRASLEDGSSGHACEPHDEPGDWRIPPVLVEALPATVRFVADFEVELHGHKLRRSGRCSYRFVDRGVGCNFKSSGAGQYWLESCEVEQRPHQGGTPIEIGVTTSAMNKSADFLVSDDSVRWLGPGLGQISDRPRTGYPWMTRGKSKAPSDLIHVGDLEDPVLPTRQASPEKRDWRMWRRAFTTRATRVTTQVDGTYVSSDEEPRLAEIYRAYQQRAHAKVDGGEARELPPSRTSSWAPPARNPQSVSSTATTAVVEAVAALGVARSGVPLREFQSIITEATGVDDFLLRQQIIRAWTEAGFVDMLRRQDRSQTIVVPRRPRFVMVRRGPTVDATLIGLAPAAVTSVVQSRCRGKLDQLPASSPYVPQVLRLRDVAIAEVQGVSSATGLADPEWLRWARAAEAPDYLRVDGYKGGMKSGRPSAAYMHDAEWDWRRRMFRSHFEATGEFVRVQRRRHPRRCSIYVILLEREEMAWCYLRSWALLRAAELRDDDPPFELSPDGVIRSFGSSPMHLPVPFGRLCTVLGKAVPGPRTIQTDQLQSYEYPFGLGLDAQVRSLLPRSWFSGPSRATRPASTDGE